MIEHIIQEKIIKDNIDKMYQFIPSQFNHLCSTKKIEYKNINLKTDYIINIINELYTKYLFTNDVRFNLWSLILKKKYGKYYNYYFDYLVNKKFIFLVSNYYVGKKCKTYKINHQMLNNIIRTTITDKILLKKYSKDFLNQSFLYFNNSPIDINIRKQLVSDLYSININYEKSLKYLNDCRENNSIDNNKYMKNLSSIDSINTGHIFFKFDEYGRMHTNFTILKKEIRRNFLTIDGEELSEIDIRNSQPFFLSLILKNEIGFQNFNDECFRFLDLVKNGLIYDELVDKLEHLNNRDDAKLIVYKVLFGNNNEKNKCNKDFKKIFPTIYEYITELKSLDNSYKEMSHRLQKMESKFIFDKVITQIKEKIPNIKLFTVHDSIVFPAKYFPEVSVIFNNLLKKEL